MTGVLSACLIVRDEEEHLPGCLTSLAAVADEIIVYDTGSEDSTRAIAEAHGAVVIDGYWDDDFARARNAALDACSGEWVLSVDADERLMADPGELLRLLATGIDAVSLPIDNLVGDGRGPLQTHYGIRLFRRGLARWAGRVHEQIGPVSEEALRLTTAEAVRLVHLGYTNEALAGRDKVARNLRMAEAEMAQRPSPVAEFQLARCLFAADRCHDAFEHYCRARDTATDRGVKVASLQYGLSCLVAMGRWDEAEEWIDELGRLSSDQSHATFYRAKLLRSRGQLAQAMELLDSIEALGDDLGTRDAPELLLFERLEVLGLLDHWPEALEIAREGIRKGLSIHELPTMVNVFRLAGEPLATLAAIVPPDHRRDVVRQLVRLDLTAVDELAEGLWSAIPGDPLLLAVVIRAAPLLALTRCGRWAGPIRAAAGPEHCPLVARAGLEGLGINERAAAAALAATWFADTAAATFMAELANRPGFDSDAVGDHLAPALGQTTH